MSLHTGVRLPPDYVLVGLIGRGSMGEVFLARHVPLDRLVAIKRIGGDWRFDDVARARILREGRIVARLSHPHIVAIYDVTIVDDNVLLIFEYVEGATLRDLLAAGPIEVDSALVVISQLADALAFAGANGVVHRDVKPSNVLVNRAGKCKLTDFGVARLFDDPGDVNSFRTRTGTRLGTPAYVSPEAARGASHPDHRADVYSLAVIAYQLLVGRLPFPERRDPIALLEDHISTEPPEPRSINPDLSTSVQDALLAGLAKDPADRPSTAMDLWEVLETAARAKWPTNSAASGRVMLARHVERALARPGAPTASESPHDATATLPSMPTNDDTVSLARVNTRIAGQDDTSARSEAHAMTRSPSISAGTPLTRITPPVFQPTSRHRPRSWLVTSIVVLCLCAVSVIALAIRHVGSPRLTTTAVAVTVSPSSGTGQCPKATFTFGATVHTNDGAGTLRFRWETPAGSTTPVDSLYVSAGTRTVVESLQFTFSGSGGASGHATFEQIQPSRLDERSTTVHYECIANHH